MGSRWYTIVIDAADPKALGRWWARVLDWKVTFEDEDETDVASGVGPDRKEIEPFLTFVTLTEPKVSKNRLHIDLAPDDRDAEVERLLALGATRADIGQGDDVTWVVLADPEGNEFCVLSAR
ncbi:MAG TPA: VOC family protein [Frankiaceae bacterium]|jgi:predicted enzyme related to lactoylglutathione lyase|nr:VOC family protein [Frankiaceae bacterium]